MGCCDGQLTQAHQPPSMPTYGKMAWNFLTTLARGAVSAVEGKPIYASQETTRIRLAICEENTCGQRVDNRCAACGCFLDVSPIGAIGKAQLAFEQCPKGLW